jgi:chaperone required for assembly of F1-ATPase
MPVTRSANAAIDKVRTQFDEVVAHLAAYGETDLLCHRAEGPTDLNLRQARAWDPVLEWAAGHLRAPLTVTTGVVAVPQPESSLVALRAYLADLSEFELAAMHDLVGLSGSLILGCAAAADYAPPDEVWHLSRIDEDWQVEQWGVDDTAAALASHKRADFLHAAHFIGLSRFQRKQSF